jgi:hypothetical protein
MKYDIGASPSSGHINKRALAFTRQRFQRPPEEYPVPAGPEQRTKLALIVTGKFWLLLPGSDHCIFCPAEVRWLTQSRSHAQKK